MPQPAAAHQYKGRLADQPADQEYSPGRAPKPEASQHIWAVGNSPFQVLPGVLPDVLNPRGLANGGFYPSPPCCGGHHADLEQAWWFVQTDKKYQLADWRVRPLSEELMLYARTDTHYLLYVYDRLKVCPRFLVVTKYNCSKTISLQFWFFVFYFVCILNNIV